MSKSKLPNMHQLKWNWTIQQQCSSF